jgi:hypothetical protein
VIRGRPDGASSYGRCLELGQEDEQGGEGGEEGSVSSRLVAVSHGRSHVDISLARTIPTLVE